MHINSFKIFLKPPIEFLRNYSVRNPIPCTEYFFISFLFLRYQQKQKHSLCTSLEKKKRMGCSITLMALKMIYFFQGRGVV